MAGRPDLLERLATALGRPGVDGVLGTPDILDDLLLMGALDDKVVVGSMNRGGLQGAAFELDDRFTAYRAVDVAAHGLEGGKMLTRICLDDPGTVATLQATADAVTELAGLGLMAMIEPFLSVRRDGRVVNLLDPESTIRSIGVASALGRLERAHLAQAAGRRRAGAGHGRDDPADPPPRRRPPGRPARHVRVLGSVA